MAGRNKKPINLHLAEGNPAHLTKAEIAERKEQELKVPFTDVKPPTYLNAKQKRKFKDIANKLLTLGIMTELDVDCLSRYIISHDLYLSYTEEITSLLEKGQLDKDLQNMQDKAFRQAQAAAASLGLTITSRCKIVVPIPPDDDDDEL